MIRKNFTVPLIETEAQLFEKLTTVTPQTVAAVKTIGDECLILGVAGKMGPSLAELLIKAGMKKVIGVDIFPNETVRKYLEGIGVTSIKADLMDPKELAKLPDVKHVFLLAGFKFGTTGREHITWAMNTLLPAIVMERYAKSKIMYLSSGNVYQFTSVTGAGANENSATDPIGEYAQSRLGGERMIQFYAERNQTEALIVRLFYATELRYGIILDVAQRIKNGTEIDLSMGYVNQIWQGDAVNYFAQLFPLCSNPAGIVNVTGADVIPVAKIAGKLGALMGIEPKLINTPAETALMGDSKQLFDKFGKPLVSPDEIIELVANWTMQGGSTLGKPTKYEKRNGKF
ncbi:NAD(P)-dependent oxidoreductase [bacterium]|nr:NAD(P)-dependent oxidoreductase [bacterium]